MMFLERTSADLSGPLLSWPYCRCVAVELLHSRDPQLACHVASRGELLGIIREVEDPLVQNLWGKLLGPRGFSDSNDLMYSDLAGHFLGVLDFRDFWIAMTAIPLAN